MKNEIKILSSLTITILLGFIISSSITSGHKESLSITNHYFSGSYKDFIFILTNNTMSLIVLSFSTIIGIWFIYFFFFINGWLIGIYFSKTSFYIFILATIPHGIIELPTFLLAGLILVHLKKGKTISKKLILFILIGLIISALIESFVTPILLRIFYRE
ncbi:stage II sporulation protein M [Staphylococcus delphini]|uniref:stage II sporulation protein M n=1 Tax=Staphylococcus delphini TaxID=53344 RepID=UPI003364B40B